MRILGTPPLEDIEGQFRLAGLRCLLGALGALGARPGQGATIWLGHGEVPVAPNLLLWPAPGHAASRRTAP